MSARAIVACGGVMAASTAVAATLLAPAACTTHQCDNKFTDTRDLGLVGDRVDDNTWETTPLDGDWLPFGPRQNYLLHVGLPNQKIVSTEAYLSVDSHPTNGGSNWTSGAGNIALFGDAVDDVDPAGVHSPAIFIANDTCGAYYIRVVVRGEPVAGAADSGAPVDAAPDVADAGAD